MKAVIIQLFKGIRVTHSRQFYDWPSLQNCHSFYNILCALVVVTGNNNCDNPNIIAPNFMEVFISFGQLEGTRSYCGDADCKK